MNPHKQNYIVQKVLSFFSEEGYTVRNLTSDFRVTSNSKSKLRVRLKSEFKQIKLLAKLGTMHPALLKITVKDNQLVFHFSKNYTKLRKPRKVCTVLYGINDSEMRVLKDSDSICIDKLASTHIGKLFSILKVGAERLFLLSDKNKKRVSLPTSTFTKETVKLI